MRCDVLKGYYECGFTCMNLSAEGGTLTADKVNFVSGCVVIFTFNDLPKPLKDGLVTFNTITIQCNSIFLFFLILNIIHYNNIGTHNIFSEHFFPESSE